MLNSIIASIWLVTLTTAIPIDNGLNGLPEIECGPRSIQVTFQLLNRFEGHVYVKGLFDEPGCRTNGDASRPVAGIELGFTSCNVQRVRSANPRGIFVRSTLIVMFHPFVMTKVDRAFTLQCFYMEADKTVDTELEVSPITTEFQTQLVPMPICRYEIRDAGPATYLSENNFLGERPTSTPGAVIKYATIGQAVYHKWTCDTETVDTFCMYVYSCFVNDGAGNDRLDLIDDNGCAIDKYLMGNVKYPMDLMGIREVHVFKYADRPALYFQCQIAISIKEPGGPCYRPSCPEPPGLGDGQIRFKRAAFIPPSTAEKVDVVARLQSFELEDQLDDLPPELHLRSPQPLSSYLPLVSSSSRRRSSEGVCLSPGAFVAAVVIAFALITAIAFVIYVINRRNL